jgi:hypothetical protein
MSNPYDPANHTAVRVVAGLAAAAAYAEGAPAEQPHIPSPPLAPTGQREDKFLTQDGAIWPVARASMTDAALIRKRMAEDLRDILRDRGGVKDPFTPITTEDLRYRGWTRDQVLAHGDAAMAAARPAEA